MQLRLALIALLLAPLSTACSTDAPGDDQPGDDQPPAATALARCADPAAPITAAWEVDNIRAPLVGLASIGSTILVSSEDGAVKTWLLPDAGGAPSAPTYGTPFVEDGDVVPALAAATGSTPAFAGLDAHGRAYVWGPTGGLLEDPISLVETGGTYVALDDGHHWLAGGTADFAGGLTVVDLDTLERHGPLETAMWGVAAAELGRDGALVTVGDWYGCPAIELRDAHDPTVVTAYWDGCHWDGPMLEGWLRAVAIDPSGTRAIAVGDGIYARFDLATLAAGPVALVQNATLYTDVAWSIGDEVAFALGTAPEATPTIDVWSTTDDQIVRRAPVSPSIGLTVDPASGLLITASADGMVRGDRCGP